MAALALQAFRPATALTENQFESIWENSVTVSYTHLIEKVAKGLKTSLPDLFSLL